MFAQGWEYPPGTWSCPKKSFARVGGVDRLLRWARGVSSGYRVSVAGSRLSLPVTEHPPLTYHVSSRAFECFQSDSIVILHQRHAGVEPPLGSSRTEDLLPGVVHTCVELVGHDDIPGLVRTAKPKQPTYPKFNPFLRHPVTVWGSSNPDLNLSLPSSSSHCATIPGGATGFRFFHWRPAWHPGLSPQGRSQRGSTACPEKGFGRGLNHLLCGLQN